MNGLPRNDPEYSLERLNGILGSGRLRFNPYSVSDRRLLEIAALAPWGGQLDITQAVTLHFTRLRETKDWRKFDGIFFRVGNTKGEGFLSAATLANGVTANDTIRRERSWIGKKPIRNEDEVEALVGKIVFVSRVIWGRNIYGSVQGAYRMHRLKGDVHKDASIIREAMCAAKIEMLERILAHPESPDYLSCSKNLINYEPRILQAIEVIRHYPDHPVPQEKPTS